MVVEQLLEDRLVIYQQRMFICGFNNAIVPTGEAANFMAVTPGVTRNDHRHHENMHSLRPHVSPHHSKHLKQTGAFIF